jgi:dUTP pyrophosphatase
MRAWEQSQGQYDKLDRDDFYRESSGGPGPPFTVSVSVYAAVRLAAGLPFAVHIVELPIQLLSPLAQLPEYATPGAAGMDLAAAVTEPTVIGPNETAMIPCGFAVAIPEGFEGQIRPRSGLAIRNSVTVLNAPGTIDSDYRGELKVVLINHGKAPFNVTAGMRIAQLVVAPIARVRWKPSEDLPATVRAAGGFGHTGT